MKIISERLNSRHTLKDIISEIKKASLKGKVAFYPCGRCSRIVLNEIRDRAPELLPKIIGCFDKSSKAVMWNGMDVYEIKKLDELKSKISLLVVTSNTFYSKEMLDIEELTVYKGPILATSTFEISLPDIGNNEILSKIEEVHELLADQKSKMVYLVTLMSRLMNDECMTYLFEGEDPRDVDVKNSLTRYKKYILEGLDDEMCKKELHAEVYEMKYVRPMAGEAAIDIGAYKGDTAVYFADRVGKRGKVYAFEPVKANYDTLLKNIKSNGLDDIVVAVNKGCSAKNGTMKAVSSKSGSPWAFLTEEEGVEDVSVTSVDEFIKSGKIEKVDFIKMDIEGFEEDAILGAVKTIKRFRPKLAICLYHNTKDLFTIPLILAGIADYKLYMRCKIEGPFAIILYCIAD